MASQKSIMKARDEGEAFDLQAEDDLDGPEMQDEAASDPTSESDDSEDPIILYSYKHRHWRSLRTLVRFSTRSGTLDSRAREALIFEWGLEAGIPADQLKWVAARPQPERNPNELHVIVIDQQEVRGADCVLANYKDGQHLIFRRVDQVENVITRTDIDCLERGFAERPMFAPWVTLSLKAIIGLNKIWSGAMLRMGPL